MRVESRTAAVVTVLVASACDSPTAPTTPPTPVPPTVQTVQEPVARPAWARGLLDGINALRRSGHTCTDGQFFSPTRALRWDARLARAAEGHALDMMTVGIYDWPGESWHTGSNGSTVGERTLAAGYPFGSGENVIWWPNEPRARWEDDPGGFAVPTSPPHCANMMNPAWRDAGVGAVEAASHTAFVTNFGSGR